MPVTDMHVKILHDLLADDPEAVGGAQEQQQGGNLGPLGPLVEAAFGVAARRAFAPSWTMPGVIQLAARVRIENAGSPVQFGALDAERELRRALGDQVPAPRSYEAAGAAMMCTLHILIADLELDEAGMDGLLTEARADADRVLAHTAAKMPGSDVVAAALRAQLAGQEDEHRRLLGQVDPAVGSRIYPALVAATFALAVERRFADASDPGIIKFVGDLRLRAAEIADHLDPGVAERLLRAALAGEDVDDVSAETSFRARLILLAGLIGDEQLDGAGLDRVLEEARGLVHVSLAG